MDTLSFDRDMLGFHDGFAQSDKVHSYIIRQGEMAEHPLVSIMIPTFQRPFLLREAIESALAQHTDIPYEVVVVDNDSEGTCNVELNSIFKEFNAPNLHWYRNTKNLGMFGNWNRCIQLARAHWVIILHDDDILNSQCLANLWANRIGSCVVSSSFKVFGPNYSRRFSRRVIDGITACVVDPFRYRSGNRRVALYDLLIDCPFCASGALFNRRACISLGGYNETIYPMSDYAFSVRYVLSFGGVILRERLVNYRMMWNESTNPQTFLPVPNGCFSLRLQIINSEIDSAAIRKWLKAAAFIQRAVAINSCTRTLDSLFPGEKSKVRSMLNNYGLNRIKLFAPALLLRISWFLCWAAIQIMPGRQKTNT